MISTAAYSTEAGTEHRELLLLRPKFSTKPSFVLHLGPSLKTLSETPLQAEEDFLSLRVSNETREEENNISFYKRSLLCQSDHLKPQLVSEEGAAEPLSRKPDGRSHSCKSCDVALPLCRACVWAPSGSIRLRVVLAAQPVTHRLSRGLPYRSLIWEPSKRAQINFPFVVHHLHLEFWGPVHRTSYATGSGHLGRLAVPLLAVRTFPDYSGGWIEGGSYLG